MRFQRSTVCASFCTTSANLCLPVLDQMICTVIWQCWLIFPFAAASCNQQELTGNWENTASIVHGDNVAPLAHTAFVPTAPGWWLVKWRTELLTVAFFISFFFKLNFHCSAKFEITPEMCRNYKGFCFLFCFALSNQHLTWWNILEMSYLNKETLDLQNSSQQGMFSSPSHTVFVYVPLVWGLSCIVQRISYSGYVGYIMFRLTVPKFLPSWILINYKWYLLAFAV